MTFSLFQQHVQNQTYRAWRPLGYIPDLDQGSAAEKQTSSNPSQQGRKYRNYHACLSACLESLEVLMNKDGIVMYLTLGGNAQRVRIRFSLAMFMGDGKSSDVLCCRMTHYKQPRTSRACYTTFDNLVQLRNPNNGRRRNPIVDCEWVLQEQQKKLLVGCQLPGKEMTES